MKWFGYLWIAILIALYILWTVKCVIEFINDLKSNWKMSYLFFEGDTWWGWWIVINLMVLFLGSLTWFLYCL